MRYCLLAGFACLITMSAYAELQEVRVGGEIRIRGRMFHNSVVTDVGRELRFPTLTVPGRALGPFGLSSQYDADDRGDDFTFIEQRTELHVTADFTDDITTFLELESWGRWGETNANGNEFRSNYLTGVDTRAYTGDDVEFSQAYIEINNTFDTPVRLRVGRQELVFGAAWLVGSQISPTLSLTYDAVRATYAGDNFTVDAWWAKLAETFGDFGDDDVDFYGLWGTYTGFEPVDISLYYLLVRDARDISLTTGSPLPELIEDWLGIDDFDNTYLHTVGLYAKGLSHGFDYSLQLAYQWGEADSAGSLYSQTPFAAWADNDAEWDAWAGDLEVGYTFETAWNPRVYVGGAYFSGEDNRDISFWDWVNPFDRPQASLAFNRLFSGQWYTASTDILAGSSAMTNFHQIRAGVTAKPLEKVTVGLSGQYLGVNEPFDWPAGFRVNGVQVGYAPYLSFWTEEADDDLGYVGHVWVKYQYSDDLWIRVGWEHFWTGDGIADGSFILKNGHELLAGSDDDGMDYVYFDTQILF